MVNFMSIFLFTIIGLSIISTLGGVYISMKMMSYINPWWSYSPGECQDIYNSVNFFGFSTVICTIIGAGIWIFISPLSIGMMGLIGKITLGLMMLVIFIGTTILHSSTTPRGLSNAFKNYSDGKKDLWTLAQKDEYQVWEDTQTIGMTNDQKKAWKDQYEEELETYIYRFNQRLTVVYFLQLFEFIGILLYFSHFLYFTIKK